MSYLLGDPGWEELRKVATYAYLTDGSGLPNPKTIDILIDRTQQDADLTTSVGTYLWYAIRYISDEHLPVPPTPTSINHWLAPFTDKAVAMGHIDPATAEYTVRTVYELEDLIGEIGLPLFIRAAAAILFSSNDPRRLLATLEQEPARWLPEDAQ